MRRLVVLLMTALLAASMGISLFHIEPVMAGSVSVGYFTNQPYPAGVPVKPIANTQGYYIRFSYTITENLIACPAITTVTPNYTHVYGLSIDIPNEFPVPSGDSNSQGYITAVVGSGTIGSLSLVSIYNRTAVVYFASATNGSVINFLYGNQNWANPMKMPPRPNHYTFNMRIRKTCSTFVPNPPVTPWPYPNGFVSETISPIVRVLSNMTPASISFSPNLPKQNAEVNVSFVLGAGEERSLYKDDRIRIWFDIAPSDMAAIPGIMYAQTRGRTIQFIDQTNDRTNVPVNIAAENITINGVKCTTPPVVTYISDPNTLTNQTAMIELYIPSEIRCSATSGTPVRIKFDKKALIFTGIGAPYDRTIKVATVNASGTNTIEPYPDISDGYSEYNLSGYGGPAGVPYPFGYLTGNGYQINTILSSPRVVVNPVDANAEATYRIGGNDCSITSSTDRLLIGAKGDLFANDGMITVEFPAGTRLPTSISPGSITVTRWTPTSLPETILSQPPIISGTKITFKTPVDLPAGSCFWITFGSSAHIRNPSVGADNYFIKLWTSAEPTIVNTQNYTITNLGYAVVNVDPPVSFTNTASTAVTCPTGSPYFTPAAPFECFDNANNDCDGTGARYTIQFSLNEACPVAVGGQFIFTFDLGNYGFLLPITAINANQILVNNTLCTANGVVATNVITVTSPINIPARSLVTVTFLPGAGIANPDIIEEFESFTVGININCFGNPAQTINSQPYTLRTQINNINLIPNWNDSVGPSWNTTYPYNFQASVNTVTGWRFDFCLGDYGDRGLGRPNLVGGDQITITFPQGTSIPPNMIANGMIRLGLHNVNIPGLPILVPRTDGTNDFGMQNVTVNGTTVTMTVPPGVFEFENSRLTLYFPPVLGIRTPPQAGSYVVTMFTSRETTPVVSTTFNIGTVVTDVGVTVTPNTSQSKGLDCLTIIGTSEFIIRFKSGPSGTLSAGDQIRIEFPAGFNKIGANFPIGSVFVNGVANPTAINYLAGNMNNRIISLPVPDYITANSLIEVIFTANAGIQNPILTVTPTIFTLQVSTTWEPAQQNSLPFTIVSRVCMSCGAGPTHGVHFFDGTGFTGTAIDMRSNTGPNGGSWLVGFQTGDARAVSSAFSLAGGISTVTIEFPARATVPAFILRQFVWVQTALPSNINCNGSNGMISASSVNVSGSRVTVGIPLNIAQNTDVYIYFCPEAAIYSPDTPGDHTIKVWTSTETESVESCPFLVMPRGMTPATVTPVPSQAGAPNVQYTIEFTLGMYGALGVGDYIDIAFMDDSPPTFANVMMTSVANPQFAGNLIPAMYVTVNDVPCILPILYTNPSPAPNNLMLRIRTPIAITQNGAIKVVLSPECRITNPTTNSGWTRGGENRPGPPNYMVSIITNKEINPMLSEEYEITPANLPTRPIIINDTCVANIPAEYSLSFITPIQLIATSTISINFPPGFYLPATMLANQVKVNGFLCTVAPNIPPNSTRVTVTVPTVIARWESVNVEFDQNLMLYNPQPPGVYQIWINIGADAIPPTTGIAGNFTVCEQIIIARVEILPGGLSSIPLGGSQVFTAKAFDMQGMIINSPNITFNWTYSNDTGYISPLSAPSTTFTAFKKGEGVLMVAATYGNRTMTSTVPIIVTGIPSSLIINPQGPTTMIKGQCYPFSAQLYDDYSPPHPITTGVTYEWELTTTNVGTVTPAKSKSTQFCPTVEGRGFIVCKATYEGSTFTANSEFIVKSGIFTLYAIPAPDLGQARVGQVTPELMFELRDESGVPKESPDTKTINVETSSPSGMFSFDKLHWTAGPKTTVTIVKGFTRSSSFYYVDTNVGNILLSGVTENVNPAFIKMNITGTSSRLRFTNEARVTASGTPSGALTLSIRDDFGQPSPPPSDTLIQIAAYPIINGTVQNNPSATGSFSSSASVWTPLIDGLITMRPGQQSIDVFYKDSVMGTYQIKAKSMIYGTDIQTLIVTQAGSVGGNLTVTVDRPIALIPSDYHISMRVGSSGQLQAGLSHIYIQFPKGTDLPVFGQADIKVNTSPTSMIPIVDKITNIVDIVVPVNVNPNGDVMIDIPRIVNPPEGNYTIKIWTSVESSPATSQPYIIGQSSVNNVTVSVTPNSAGIPAQYIVKFRTGPSGTIGKGDEIIIEFPVGTILPAKIEPKYVRIHGLECTVSPIITGLQVKVFNTMPAGPDTEWDVMFDITANITNPPVPKTDYKIRLGTKPEPKLVDSTPYEITLATTITEFTVKTSPPTVSEKARWELAFKLGANGALIPNDEIFVQMNDEILPASIAADYVSINGIKPASDVTIDGKRLKFRLKGGISAGQQVIITIDANAGVRNPDKPGSEYRLSVFTTKEPYAVMSQPFTIESSVVVTYSLNPVTPNGKHNWYTVPISISFESNVPADITWQYDGEQWQNYTAPFFISKTGQSVIYVKAKSRSTGTESAPKRIVVKYDPNAPKITITTPPDGSQVKDSVINIIGSVLESESGDVTLTMNGEGVPISGSTFSKQVVLKPGLNAFTFQAEDTAGNQATFNYKIELKNQPPLLVIDKPGFLDVVSKVELIDIGQNKKQLNATVDISGYCELGIAQIKVTPVTVPGASQTITVGADGKFTGSLKFPAVGGQNEYNVEITDKLGNVSTKKIFIKVQIKFVTQIQNQIASLNGSEIKLASPPIIEKSRTLVPFRILGESFGANVDWDAATRTAIYVLGDTRIELQIGATQAKIIKGGVAKFVKLDVPAKIINGSTMVPIRFVSENFGARVGWTQATKTVTVDYPAP